MQPFAKVLLVEEVMDDGIDCLDGRLDVAGHEDERVAVALTVAAQGLGESRQRGPRP